MKKDLYKDTEIKIKKVRGENEYEILMIDKESGITFAFARITAKKRKGNYYLGNIGLGYGDEWFEFNDTDYKDAVRWQMIDMMKEDNYPDSYIQGFIDGYYMTEWF